MNAPGRASREWPTSTPVTPLVGATGSVVDVVTSAAVVVVVAGITAPDAPATASRLSTAPASRSDVCAGGNDLIATRRDVPTAPVTAVGVVRSAGPAF